MLKYEERRCGIWRVLKGHPGEPACDHSELSWANFLPAATPQVSISLLSKAGPTEVKIARRQSGEVTETVIPGVACDLEDPGSSGSQPRAAFPEGASSKGLELVAVGLWIVPAVQMTAVTLPRPGTSLSPELGQELVLDLSFLETQAFMGAQPMAYLKG